MNGRPIHHLSLVSSFCEYTVVPHNGAITIDPATSDEQACLLGCGAMAGIGAALNTAQIRRVKASPSSAAAASAERRPGRQLQCLPIVAVDLAPRRRPRHCASAPRISSNASRAIRWRIREITGGGADFTFEATARSRSWNSPIRRHAGPGRRYLIGQPTENAMAGFPPYWIA